MAAAHVSPGLVSFLDKTVEAISSATAPSSAVVVKEIPATQAGGGTLTVTVLVPSPTVEFGGLETTSQGDFFFERVWTRPSVIELGNLVSTVIREIEVYNSFRDAVRSLTAAVANAGDGVSLLGLPGLPFNIAAQAGLIIDVQVLTSGPPDIDGTIDFTLDTGSQSVVITGTRVVMFPYQPEGGITERLQFLTRILTATDGTEQRMQLRKNPRQLIQMNVRTLIDANRRRLQHLLFAFQPGVFGLPIWWEARHLTSDASVSDTTIQVDTSYGDFRSGGLLIVWKSPTEFDSVEIVTVNSSNITLSSALTFDFEAGQTVVMPLRLAYMEPQLEQQRWKINLEEFQFNFTVLDNDVDLADTTAYSQHNSKVMLDDPNVMAGETIPDALSRQVTRIDNRTAAMLQSSNWLNSVFSTTKGFNADSRQLIWRVRQLAHALRGSQISFYMPTFFEDLVLADPLVSGSFTMDIEHADYSIYVKGLEPNKSLWIELNDGTILTRIVDSAVEVDSLVERLTLSTSWASSVPVADIKRISYLRLSRIADDEVVFDHIRVGEAKVNMNVRAVRQ